MNPQVVSELLLGLLGLCVGSFLNVVIYRLPAGLALTRPARSFCPACHAPIAWFDNLPVLSWLLLRGRCRHCRGPISVQYPLIEALCSMAFVLVYHLLFVIGTHAPDGPARLPCDTPLLLAWLTLVAALLACAAMDIASYTVDVRVTLVAVAAGLFFHAVWPRPPVLLPVAATPAGGGLLAAGLVSLAVLVWALRRPDSTAPNPDLAAPGASDGRAGPTESAGTRLGGVLGTLAALGLAAWAVAQAGGPPRAGGTLLDPVAGGGLIVLFLATVVAGSRRRAADDEIRRAIEDEQPAARRTALRELLSLMPTIVSGVAIWLAVLRVPPAAAVWHDLVHWSPGHGLTPVAGLTYAVGGALIAAAAGWALRIIFTLVFGREAFGTGDIYILAAAGAAGGWDIALLGLLLSVGVALAGWLLSLLGKSSVMIPFGPWLAVGVLMALWLRNPAGELFRRYGDALRLAWHDQPQLIAVAGGLMLVASAGAVALARLVRRFVSP